MIPLFEQYPALGKKLPYVRLGCWPTPVERLERMGQKLGLSLYMKRDDRCGARFGGNKVRKLEFILGSALMSKAKAVLTFGFTGSNHAAATAVHADRFGMKTVCVLARQPKAEYVKRNLLIGAVSGATHCHSTHMPGLFLEAMKEAARCARKFGQFPHIIPPGGSSPLGNTGYVNAALELEQQIENGELPGPDYIYVPLGSGGTAAGLIAGLAVTRLKSRVVCVRVVHKLCANKATVSRLIQKTAAFLHKKDSSFPKPDRYIGRFEIENGFFGKGYAEQTENGKEAVSEMMKHESIRLETTYTGKTFAALINAAKGRLKNKTVLFWHTWDSSDFITETDCRALPDFQSYFV